MNNYTDEQISLLKSKDFKGTYGEPDTGQFRAVDRDCFIFDYKDGDYLAIIIHPQGTSKRYELDYITNDDIESDMYFSTFEELLNYLS